MTTLTADHSTRSTVLVCHHPGCFWRHVDTSRRAALAAGAVHLAEVHDDHRAAGDWRQRAQRATR